VAVTVANPEDNEIVWASFPIEKMETDADGDLVVYGKASDGGLDSDNQIVDPAWMAKAAPLWLNSGGNVRVQHNPQRDPAGVGIKVETDATGATYVTAKVIEPVAQKLVSRGALRAYSVGIAKPTIQRDASAPGGRITGGELVEISLVDRPANKRCGITMVKSEAGAQAEYVGEIFGSQEDIAKALLSDVFKGYTDGKLPEGTTLTLNPSADLVVAKNDDMSLTFTPNDLMKIVQNKFVEKHYDELAWQAVADEEAEALKNASDTIEKDHREFSTNRRKDLAGQGNALPDGSYPIPDADALRRAAILARSGHGNVSGARALIARRAKELGVANPLTSGDTEKKVDDVVDVVKEADPVITKDPVEDAPKKKDKAAKKPKAKGGKKLPPWLADQAGADAEKADAPTDDMDEDDPDDATCKTEHTHTEKCSPSGTPASAAGVSDAPPMKEIPNTGPAPESPMPAGRKTPDTKAVVPEMHSSPEVSALLRFKTIGIDTDLGRLHDLTCPAFSPEDVAKYHPFADFKSVIDTGIWQRKAVDAACGDLAVAKSMTQIWQAAEALKFADEGDLNDYRAEMHKAFRDANPGPTSYPSPGSISPEKYNRPLQTGGHAASSPGHDGPNSSPTVASTPVGGVHDFPSPPMSAAHQSPSPNFNKNDFDGVPGKTGEPMVIHYAALEKEKARRSLSMMHDHLMHAFPQACPMLAQNAYAVEDGLGSPALNPIVGIGKEETTEVEPQVEKAVTDFSDEWIEKAQKKMRKKLGKKVLAGKITVDEARAKMGRTIAQKNRDAEIDLAVKQVADGVISIDEARANLNLAPLTKAQEPVVSKAVSVDVATPGVDADVIKSAIVDAFKPLLEQIQTQNKQIEELNAYKAQSDSRFEKLADLADPTTAGFVGMMNPVQKGRPAGVPAQAEIAERTQQMMIAQLKRTARMSDKPAEREAAQDALMKYGNFE
jgi:hypothetical protein